MQIKNISRAILDEYHMMFGKEVTKLGGDIDSETLEEQKCQLNYELNCSGKYFAFKEQLKVNVHLFNYSVGFMKHLLYIPSCHFFCGYVCLCYTPTFLATGVKSYVLHDRMLGEALLCRSGLVSFPNVSF